MSVPSQIFKDYLDKVSAAASYTAVAWCGKVRFLIGFQRIFIIWKTSNVRTGRQNGIELFFVLYLAVKARESKVCVHLQTGLSVFMYLPD